MVISPTAAKDLKLITKTKLFANGLILLEQKMSYEISTSFAKTQLPVGQTKQRSVIVRATNFSCVFTIEIPKNEDLYSFQENAIKKNKERPVGPLALVVLCSQRFRQFETEVFCG